MKKTASVIFCLFFIFSAVVPSAYSAQETLDVANPDGIDENLSEENRFEVLGSDYNEEEGYKDPTASFNVDTMQTTLDDTYNDSTAEKSEEIIVINDEIVSKNPSLKHLSKPNKNKVQDKKAGGRKEGTVEPKKEEEKELAPIPKKVHSVFRSFLSIGIVSSVLGFISTAWQKTKNFIKSLPGIRHYLNSKYSKENYKKELSGPAIEVNKTNIKNQDTEAMNMLQKDGVDEKVLEKTTSTGKKVKVQPL